MTLHFVDHSEFISSNAHSLTSRADQFSKIPNDFVAVAILIQNSNVVELFINDNVVNKQYANPYQTKVDRLYLKFYLILYDFV